MKLFHGTAAKHLNSILRDGICPRGKKPGNWKRTVTSNPDNVYLSLGYAIYFAASAISKEKEEPLVVFEVDTAKLNPFNLLPDEDWLEQVSRKRGPAPIDRPMAYRTRWYRRRLKEYQDLWEDSLNGMGTCSHDGVIPPEAITRYATLDFDTYLALVFNGMDPMITTLNWALVGTRYRNYLRWLFDDPQEIDPTDFPQRHPELARANMSLPRDGVTVVTLEGKAGQDGRMVGGVRAGAD